MRDLWGCRLGKVIINDLVARGIIGINAWEREQPQDLLINLEMTADFSGAFASDDIADCVDYQKVAQIVTAHVASAKRFTVEALAADLARIVLAEPGVDRVRIRVEKPGAVASCKSVGVEIEWPSPAD